MSRGLFVWFVCLWQLMNVYSWFSQPLRQQATLTFRYIWGYEEPPRQGRPTPPVRDYGDWSAYFHEILGHRATGAA